jgi:hypothetical protein
MAELSASTSLLPLAKSPSRHSSAVQRRVLKNGRLQFRLPPSSPNNTLSVSALAKGAVGGAVGELGSSGSSSGVFKPSQVTLLDDQLAITLVDRSVAEIVVPLRKKTVVRQAASGDGEFLVDKHCLKGTMLEMHEWIDAISAAIQRSGAKNRLSGDGGSLLASSLSSAAAAAGSSDEDDDDSSSSSAASGVRRRKGAVTRRRQVHGSIAGATDDGKRTPNEVRRLTRQHSGVDVAAAAASEASTPEHDDDDGSSSSSSVTRTRRIKKRESNEHPESVASLAQQRAESALKRVSIDISGSSGSFGDGGGDGDGGGGNGSSGSGVRAVREGWLCRKGESMFGGAYKKKWAVLDATSLRFFESEKDMRKSGAATRDAIPLGFASVKIASDKRSGEAKYHFDVYSGQKRHEFYADTEQARNEWHDAINGVCSSLMLAAAAGGDKRDPVFGVPLALVLDGQRDTHAELTIPYAVHRILQAFKAHNGAKTERIFRVEADAAALAQYRLAFEEHRFEAEPADAHVAAALLKTYLYELPTPIFNKATGNLISDALALGTSDDAALQRCIKVLERADEPSRALVVALCDALAEVCHPDRVEYSKMPADKLAEIFAPLCFGGADGERIVRQDERLQTFVRLLISGARSVTRALGPATSATESTPATYLRGINGRPVVTEGWLMKRGRLRTKKRWVILDERALYVFDAPEERWPPKETLDLAGATANHVDGSRTRFSFRAAAGGKDAETEFEAGSGQELEVWLSAVQWKIKLCSGSDRAPVADVSKVTHADAKEALRARGNDVCCDCATPAPALCSVDKGVLLCAACADAHKAAMPSSEIKSLLELPDGWSPADIQTLKSTGNGRANDRFEANLAAADKPAHSDAAFVRRKWLDRAYALSDSAQALLAACEQMTPLRLLVGKLLHDEAFVQQAVAILAAHEAADKELIEQQQQQQQQQEQQHVVASE